MDDFLDKLLPTEDRDVRFSDIDTWSTREILTALAESHMAGTATVYTAIPQIELAVNAIFPLLLTGGRLFYVGAGASGRIALQDAIEVVSTFSWPRTRLVVLLANGLTNLFSDISDSEDQEKKGEKDIMSYAPGCNDVVLGIAASGRTPYTCSAVEAAQKAGALTVSICANPNTRIEKASNHTIILPTGPEVIRGATRLKAGTAQKAAINTLSTTVMIRLGHVHAGEMINMKAINAKLRLRATRIMARFSEGTEMEFIAALNESEGNLKLAILIRHGLSLNEAKLLLSNNHQNLRNALSYLQNSSGR